MLAGMIALGTFIHFILFKLAKIITKRKHTLTGEYIIKHCRKPLLLVIILIIVNALLPLFRITVEIRAIIREILSPLVIISLSWLFIKVTYVLEDLILSRFQTDIRDNLKARSIQTQVLFLKKIAIIIIAVLAFAAILMTFDKVRQFGTSILASAGIIGIVVGLAAQRYIGTFLAGLQIAFTQPIRIDDLVIVENEFGKIEDITLTYVVVRIWDLRRLVLPITYFIEKPFQNWTRASSDLMGTVYLYVDYTVPVQAVREEFDRILKQSPLWDRKVSGIQVTNATDKTMELRALVSAADASGLWDLRCEVREKLVTFIQKNYPESLPRVRTEFIHEPPVKPDGDQRKSFEG